VRRQQRGALQRIRGLAQGAPGRGRRSLRLALREPELREPGLRLPTFAARLQVGLLRSDEVTQQSLELTLPVEGDAPARRVDLQREPLGRAPRLRERKTLRASCAPALSARSSWTGSISSA